MMDEAKEASAAGQGLGTSLATSSAAPTARLPLSKNSFVDSTEFIDQPSPTTSSDSDQSMLVTSHMTSGRIPNLIDTSPEDLAEMAAGFRTQLPEELWLKIIENLTRKDLKNIRLVRASFAEFVSTLSQLWLTKLQLTRLQATKTLFRNVVFSPEPSNISSLKLLSMAQHLNKHVECLYLDTTTYQRMCTPELYAKLASEYFCKVFGLGTQSTGPLSHGSLHTILLTDSEMRLGSGFLSGRPRRAFVAGCTLYSARAYYLQDLLDESNRKLFGIFNKLLAGFTNLKAVETIPFWTSSDQPYQKAFRLFLSEHLPQKTLDLIPGLEETNIGRASRSKGTTSAFAAPGVTARDLHVMMLPPNHGVCFHDTQMYHIARVMLLSLRTNKIRLEALSLPGPDFIGQKPDASIRQGAVPFTTLLSTVKVPDIAKPASILLPVLRRLKVLELNIDFRHRGRSGPLPEARERNRLRHAIQQMDQLECLSLGAPAYLVGDPAAWNLTDLLLFRKSDYPEQSDDQDGPAPAPGHGLDGMLQMLMNMAPPGMTFAPAGGPPIPPNLAHSNTTGSTPTTSTAGPTDGPAGVGPGADIPAVHITGAGVTTIDAHGDVISHALNPGTSNPVPPSAVGDAPKDVKLPDTPLKPNPWPNLRYLSLWNLPSSPKEVSRLARTVKDSLRTLELSRVYFARPDMLMDVEDGVDLDDFIDFGFGLPPPLMGDGVPGPSAGANFCADSADEQEDNMPGLVEMQQGPVPVTTTSNAETLPSEPIQTAASAAPALSDYVPIEHAGPPSAFPGSLMSTLDPIKPHDTSTMWLSTIELLAEELRLRSCNITFEDHDEAYLRVKLAKDLTDVPKGPLGQLAEHYLLEGEGMGFTLFMANRIQEQKQKSAEDDIGLDDDLEEDEDDDWEEDVEEAEPILAGSNIHICSVWQACPDA